MKNIITPVLFSVIMLTVCSAAVGLSNNTLNGAAQFKSSFSSSYMAKHGYVFIEESNKSNIFAAGDAEIIIKNKNGKLVGKGKTDREGAFSIAVPEGESYKVIIKYHDRETEYEVSSLKTRNFIAYLGEFDSDEVGSWIDAKLKIRY